MKKKFDWSQLRQRVGKKKKTPTNWIITIITIIAMVCSLSVCCVNSYQRTQMNLRGLSCWMLPSRPDSPLGLLPFGQGALAAARPRRCLHFTPTPPACFTFWRLWLSHASARLLSTPAAARLESASPILPCLARLPACLGSRCASVCAELPLQHTLKVPRIKIVKTGRTLRGSGTLEHTGQTGSVGLDACHAEIGYGFHVPL